jgi:hypothetical protein
LETAQSKESRIGRKFAHLVTLMLETAFSFSVKDDVTGMPSPISQRLLKKKKKKTFFENFKTTQIGAHFKVYTLSQPRAQPL